MGRKRSVFTDIFKAKVEMWLEWRSEFGLLIRSYHREGGQMPDGFCIGLCSIAGLKTGQPRENSLLRVEAVFGLGEDGVGVGL